MRFLRLDSTSIKILLTCQNHMRFAATRGWRRAEKLKQKQHGHLCEAKECQGNQDYEKVIFQYSLGDINESKDTRVPKYKLSCPFCSAHRKGSKKNSKCPALIWLENRGCFRFQCVNAGSYQWKSTLEFPEFLERLNPGLFREYLWERFLAGRIGGRWNYRQPPQIMNLMAGGSE